MSLEIDTLMARLATKRPIFHSEADFQHALGWEIHLADPDAQLRLELPFERPGSRAHLDILVREPEAACAIELKHKTRGIHTVCGNEEYNLKSQSAQDIGRYDFLRDLERIQYLCAETAVASGHVVLLTNDSSYWAPLRSPEVSYAHFSLADGRVVEGTLRWGPTAGEGTTKGRAQPIHVDSPHKLRWSDYSEVSSGTYGRFRYLWISIGPSPGDCWAKAP
jgi:hypothetical protein